MKSIKFNLKQKTKALKNMAATAFVSTIFFTPKIGLAAGGSPFATGSGQLKSDLLTILTPIAGIAVIAVGVACWMGKISWWWLASLFVGIVLVFGNDQIVSWLRGMAGV